MLSERMHVGRLLSVVGDSPTEGRSIKVLRSIKYGSRSHCSLAHWRSRSPVVTCVCWLLGASLDVWQISVITKLEVSSLS